jgi:hypothetical protein
MLTSPNCEPSRLMSTLKFHFVFLDVYSPSHTHTTCLYETVDVPLLSFVHSPAAWGIVRDLLVVWVPLKQRLTMLHALQVCNCLLCDPETSPVQCPAKGIHEQGDRHL